jgi:hypothetical protein
VALTPAVAQAISEIRESFAGHEVVVAEDGDGGAYVRVADCSIGPQYRPSASWVAFRITFQYPDADVYPHYVVAKLERVDGKALGEGFGQATYRDAPVTQLSRRSNHRDTTVDTAAAKLWKVLQWLQTR